MGGCDFIQVIVFMPEVVSAKVMSEWNLWPFGPAFLNFLYVYCFILLLQLL